MGQRWADEQKLRWPIQDLQPWANRAASDGPMEGQCIRAIWGRTRSQLYQNAHHNPCKKFFRACREKTGLRGFRQGLTQTGLYSLRNRLEARNCRLKKKRNCTIRVAKTKALNSCEAELRLCFRTGKNPVFSRRGSFRLQKSFGYQ